MFTAQRDRRPLAQPDAKRCVRLTSLVSYCQAADGRLGATIGFPLLYVLKLRSLNRSFYCHGGDVPLRVDVTFLLVYVLKLRLLSGRSLPQSPGMRALTFLLPLAHGQSSPGIREPKTASLKRDEKQTIRRLLVRFSSQGCMAH